MSKFWRAYLPELTQEEVEELKALAKKIYDEYWSELQKKGKEWCPDWCWDDDDCDSWICESLLREAGVFEEYIDDIDRLATQIEKNTARRAFTSKSSMKKTSL